MAAVARFKALPPWAKHVRWIAVILTTSPWIVLNAFRFLPAWMMLVVVFLYAVLGLQALMPQTVEVGADGVMLRSLGHRRFLPFRRIVAVDSTPLGVELLLVTGRTVEIRLTQKSNAATSQIGRLHRAIEDGRKAFAQLARAEEEAFVARGDRDLDAWLRDMRALGEGARGGYRALAIPTERLWEIAANASADPSAREGAVLALSTTLDADGERRLREIAEATADPRLRAAFGAIASAGGGDVQKVRVALDELEELEEEEEPAVDARRRS